VRVTPEVGRKAQRAIYRVTRPTRRRAVLVREDSMGASLELGRSERTWGVDWLALSRALLTDALGQPPRAKLARDFSRFLAVRPGGTWAMSGADLAEWLATWQPPLAAIFRARRGHQ
jgi:hypothetical protein